MKAGELREALHYIPDEYEVLIASGIMPDEWQRMKDTWDARLERIKKDREARGLDTPAIELIEGPYKTFNRSGSSNDIRILSVSDPDAEQKVVRLEL